MNEPKKSLSMNEAAQPKAPTLFFYPQSITCPPQTE